MGEQPRREQAMDAGRDAEEKHLAATRRRIDGFMRQITVADPAERKASLRHELTEAMKPFVKERLPEVEAIIDAVNQESFASEPAYLEALARQLNRFVNTRFDRAEIERTQRETIATNPKNVMLNEALYYGVGDNDVHLHVAPMETLSMGRKLALLRQGLRTLAEQLATNENLKDIEEVTATSWIVAEHPNLLQMGGFTIDGPIDEETRRAHFADETRPVARAHMSRADFLERYGT